jgi:hypothetical protein
MDAGAAVHSGRGMMTNARRVIVACIARALLTRRARTRAKLTSSRRCTQTLPPLGGGGIPEGKKGFGEEEGDPETAAATNANGLCTAAAA